MRRDDHTSFAGGDLLIWIEAEHRGIAERSDATPFVFRAKRLASVLDDEEAVAAGDRHHGIHVRRLTEHVHDENSARSAGDSCFERPGVDVQRRGVNICEYRYSSLEQDAVGRR